MKINYDADVDALSVTLRKGAVSRTVEIAPEIMMDFDKNGRPLYIEILNVTTKVGKTNIDSIRVGETTVPLRVA